MPNSHIHRSHRAIAHAEILTVMMVDLCSYTKISTNLGRHALHELHDFFDELVMPMAEEHHGKIIKKIGDAFLVTFKSPTNALHSAIEIQRKFEKFNQSARFKIPLKVKIAVHTGEVILRDNDIYGDAVNIVSRMEKLVKPTQILFSNSVFMSMNKSEIPFIYLGAKRLKGVRYPVKVFLVRPNTQTTFKSNYFFNNLIKILLWLGLFFLIYWFFKNYV